MAQALVANTPDDDRWGIAEVTHHPCKRFQSVTALRRLGHARQPVGGHFLPNQDSGAVACSDKFAALRPVPCTDIIAMQLTENPDGFLRHGVAHGKHAASGVVHPCADASEDDRLAIE